MLAQPLLILFKKGIPLSVSPLKYLQVCNCRHVTDIPLFIFRLIYPQSVNNKPNEIEFITSSYFFGLFGSDSMCRDGLNNNPSCGVALDRERLAIPDSQGRGGGGCCFVGFLLAAGFCCSCSLGDSVGSSSNSYWRNSQLKCALFGLKFLQE